MRISSPRRNRRAPTLSLVPPLKSPRPSLQNALQINVEVPTRVVLSVVQHEQYNDKRKKKKTKRERESGKNYGKSKNCAPDALQRGKE